MVRTAPTDAVPQRLAALQSELRALISELRPEVVAVERVFFQRNARTAMAVAQASGVAMAEAATAGCEVVQYSPTEVKLAVSGDGAAGKAQVERMVKTLLGLPAPPKPADAADACALALCHLSHGSLRRRVALANGRI